MMKTYDTFIVENTDKEGDKKEYEKFFQAKLKKFGVKEPDELDKDQKKKFYDEVDSGWKADNEQNESTINEKVNNSLVKKVAKDVDWDYFKLVDFLDAVMRECNFSSEAKKVIPFMKEQW